MIIWFGKGWGDSIRERTSYKSFLIACEAWALLAINYEDWVLIG
jgi:hypothetical protein